jgi:hypothetical protein
MGYKHTLQNNVTCCIHPTLERVHTWANDTSIISVEATKVVEGYILGNRRV